MSTPIHPPIRVSPANPLSNKKWRKNTCSHPAGQQIRLFGHPVLCIRWTILDHSPSDVSPPAKKQLAVVPSLTKVLLLIIPYSNPSYLLTPVAIFTVHFLRWMTRRSTVDNEMWITSDIWLGYLSNASDLLYLVEKRSRCCCWMFMGKQMEVLHLKEKRNHPFPSRNFNRRNRSCPKMRACWENI